MLKPRRRHPPGAARRGQRGLSLVELMVGVTIGLIIAAAATLLMTGQLIENRRLVSETQVQQDLRAATDLMARELRRVGAANELNVLGTVWHAGSSGASPNAMASTLTLAPSKVEFNYQPIVGPSAVPPFSGFELQGSTVRTRIGGQWQELTDPNTLRVTALTPTVVSDGSAAIVLPCAKACPPPGGPTDCWPRFEVRRARVTLQVEAKADATVQRSLSSSTRLRNDLVRFNAISAAGVPALCPA